MLRNREHSIEGVLSPSREISFKTFMTTSFQSVYLLFVKRAIDLFFSSLLLVIMAAPMVLIGMMISLDSPGSPLFFQRRVGKNGKQFTMWKFRTMHQSSVDELIMLVDKDGKQSHKIKNDPRVTRLGKLLRKTSIDELPQLVNVLLGHMSLVGPRPELPQIVAHYEPWQHRRHHVLPGITGWWQVSGRSDLPMHEHTELDIFYVDSQSFWLDMKIIAKTITSVTRGSGAY